MAKTSLGTSVYGPDPSYVEGLSNIASMFDPKAQAAGALAQAHSAYYGNQAKLAEARARLNAARAAGVEDSNAVYGNVASAFANGMTPLQYQTWRAARDTNYRNVQEGLNASNGADLIRSGDIEKIRQGMLIANHGAAAAVNPSSAFTVDDADRIAARDTANKIAIAQGTPRSVSNGQIAYTIQNGKVVPLISGNVDLAPGHTYYSNQGGTLTQSAQSPVATGSAADPLKSAKAKLGLNKQFQDLIFQRTSVLSPDGKTYSKSPNPEQVATIAAQATKLTEGGVSPLDALEQAATTYGIKLNPQSLVAETKPGWLWDSKTGNYNLGGFNDGSQGVLKPSESAPVITPKTQAEIDNAPVGAILVKPDGTRFIKSAPKPSVQSTQGSTVNVSNSPLAAQIPQAMPETASPGIDYGKLQDLFNTVDPSKARGIVGIDHPFMSAGEAASGISDVANRLGVTQAGQPLTPEAAFALKSKIAETIAPMAMQDPRVAQWAKGNFGGDVGLPDDAMKAAEALGINRQQYGIPEAGWAEKTPLGLGSIIAMKSYGELNKSMPEALQRFYSDLQNRNKVAQQ